MGMNIWPFSGNKNIEPLHEKNSSQGYFQSGSFHELMRGGMFRIDSHQAYTIYNSAGPLSSAIDRVSSGVSGLKLIVVDEEEQVIPNHPALEVFKNPGFGQTWQAIAKTAAVSHLLTGNSYFLTDVHRRTLRTIKDNNVSIEENSMDGFAESYNVSTGGSTYQMNTFNRSSDFKFVDSVNSELVHNITETSTNSNVVGHSILSSILVDICQRVEGGKHNLALLKNGMRSSVALSFSNDLKPAQIKLLKKMIADTKAGSENAGNILILPYGGDVKELSTSNRDMDYKSVISGASEMIALAYKVPLPLVVTQRQTLDNFAAATQALYDDAVFPLADIMLGQLTKLFQLEEGQRLSYEKNEIPAIRKRRYEEAQILSNSNSFSVDEIRARFGGEPIGPERGGDNILMPINVVPLERDMAAQIPEGIEPEREDDGEDREDNE